MPSENQNINALESFISFQSDKILKGIRTERENWKSEEDVRHGCNHHFDQFIEDLVKSDFGLEITKIKSNHEVRAGSGSMDTLYGFVMIEYKKPNLIKTQSDEQKVVNQIQGYFEPYSVEKNIEQKKLLGVGLDGYNMLFVTKTGDIYDIEHVGELSSYHIKKILKAIVRQGSIGKSYSAENLAEDFGSANIHTKQGIKRIYECIKNASHPKTMTIFSQWKLLFGEVCGFDVEGKNDKIASLADFYDIGKKDVFSAKLLFSVHTYYSLFMKLLAAEILSRDLKYTSSFVKKLSKSGDDELKKEMAQLEDGSIWSKFGIKNLLEGDLFSWYISSWDDNMAEAIQSIAERLSDYDANSLATDDKGKKDLLKSLYQMLFPKTLRHDLGEYYTPDWLAELVLNELGYGQSLEDLPNKRLLDPACGSGTFLVEAINRVITWNERRPYQDKLNEEELLRHITANIMGFDLNPLAVIASRVNYLMAISELIRHGNQIEIPVYLCDSIATPNEQYNKLYSGHVKILTTVVGDFEIPMMLTEKPGILERFTNLLDHCIENETSTAVLIKRCQNENLAIAEDSIEEIKIKQLYEKIMKLKQEDRNGIWVRIIRNAFAPLFCGKFDFVAGNPPWINWESLPNDYREKHLIPINQEKYNLFLSKGLSSRHGGSKIDISTLMVYVSHDKYLKVSGKLGFVITQSVFKTKGGGEGFRSFSYTVNGNPKTYLRPLVVHDMSDFQPFEGATNRTAVFICDKSHEPFTYPVSYIVWKKTGKGQIDTKASLKEANMRIEKQYLEAIPVNEKEKTSPWLTASKEALFGILKVIGKSYYTAHEGVNSGGLNGCFWIRVLERFSNGNLLIENLYDVGKKKCEKVQEAIEPDMVYPLLRGRDVKRWNAEPSCYILIPQDIDNPSLAYPKEKFPIDYPKTHAYFKRFEKQLNERGSKVIMDLAKKQGFWFIYSVKDYTLSPWKVVWTRVANDVKAGVLGLNQVAGEMKPTLPIETATMVDFKDEKEAHYFCAMLNSTPSRMVVISTSVAGTGGFAPPNILEKVSIPKFDPANKAHARLAKLSMNAHEAAKAGDIAQLAKIEADIDKEAAKLWGITPDELAAIQQAIAESKPQREPKTEEDEEE